MEDTKTLFEIENSFEDSNTDRIIPQESDWTPRETVLPLTDAYKTYTQQADLVRAVLMRPKASVVEKVGRGLKRTSDMLLDIPENFVNMMARATNGYTYPNMTEQEANEVLEAGVRSMLATKQARAITEEYEGVADSDITKWVGMVGQVGAYAVIGYLTGGTGIGILGGIQTAGETSQEWAEKYYKDNYGMRGYNAAGDTLWAMTHGAISGFIESKLGVERMAEKAIVKTGAKRALKQAALGAIGEGAEEALQELSAFMLGNVAGSETRTEKEFLHDALTSAMYGSILGGPFGGGLYYVNRSKIASMFKRQGYSDEDAVKLATTVIDDGKSALIKEIGTVNSLKEKIGSPFDSLVTKIDSALTSAGWTDTDPFVILEDGRIERKSAIEEGTAYTEASRLDYATYVASDIAGQVLRQADKAQVPTSDILNLAEIEVHGNMLSLKPQKLRTSKQIKSNIESVNADLKTARAELRAENAKKTTLQTDPKRVEQLRGIINDLTTKKGILQQLLTSKQSIEKAQDVATERKKQQIGLDTAQSFKDAKTVAKKQSATEFTQSITKKDATVDAKTAQKRYNNAIVAWLCDGDTRLFDQLMTSNGMTVKAIESIVQYGQQIMAFDAAHPELGLRADMQNALSRMLEMKHKGEFKQFVQQDGTFAENALMYNMVFAQHTGDIGAFLQSYIQRAESNTQFTKDDLLFQTLKEIYPTQFDGDTATDKDLVAVFVSQNNQQPGEIVNQADIFKPVKSQLSNFREKVRNIFQGKANKQSRITVLNETPAVYQALGFDKKPLSVSYGVISKINKDKHNVPVSVVEDLPELVSDPVAIFKSKTDPDNSVVAVLDAKDTGERTVVSIVRKTDGSYNVIPSVYGKDNFENFVANNIKDGNLLYIDENKAAIIRPSSLQLLGVYNSNLSNNNYITKNTLVNQSKTILSQRTQANGMYDPELNVIVLGRNFNTTTLPHELSHFWLNNTFQLFKQAQKGYPVAQEWLDETQRLFDILGIDANQDTLTREQQENWASMNEAIITGLANVPDGATLPITGYLNWIPEKYKSLLNIGYRDKNGKVVYPILDKAAMDFFNVWYGNITLPALPTSPAREQASNPVSESGETVPSTPQVIKERTEQINKAIKDQTDADKALYESAVDELPTETRAGINAEYTKYDDVSGLTVEKLPEDKGWFKQGKRHQRDEMIKKAREYVKKNAEHAREVALMGKPALNDTGIDLETLILAVMEFDKVDSKSDLGFRYMHNIAMTRSEAGTTLGLHAQDGSYQTYLDGYRRLTAAMTESAAYKYAGRGADSITKFNNDVEALCAKYADAVENGSMSREQALKALVAEASVKFAGEEDTTILNQLDLTQSGKTREAFVEYAKRLVRRDIAKAEPDTKMQGKLLALAPQAEKASQDLNSKNPATASAAAKKMREWSELVHSADPRQTMLSGAINSYAPRAMLSGISTHVTNVFGSGIEQTMLRPAIAAHYGKNIVPQADIDAEKARIKAVYDATFMNLTSMITPTDPTLVHGEKYKPLDPDAKGWQKVYDAPMRALAAEDNWFRIPTYLDIAARMASRDANGDVNKAKELFKQYTSTQPKKINGKENPLYAKRAEIVTMSAFATFTQNGKLAGALNKMRDGLNSLSVGGYELQLGTLIAPFIKTPANIIASGLRSPFGAGVTLYKKLAGKEISFQDAADTAHFIGLAMLALLAGAFCDYEEPYKGGKYNPNKPYDSIGIGGYWLKLNALGVLEAPMRVFMSALHGGQVEILETVGSVPLIGELVDNRLNYATKNPTGWAAGTVYNQANKLIPTLVKQVAKPVIKSTGAETDIESIDLGFKTGIGGKIERTWGLDGIDPTINDWLGIVFNRIKITD